MKTLLITLGIYWAYFVVVCEGLYKYCRNVFSKITSRKDKPIQPSLVDGTMIQKVYINFVYGALGDCFARISTKQRTDCKLTLKDGKQYVDFGSYDYLGFGCKTFPLDSELPRKLSLMYNPPDRQNCDPEYKSLLLSTESMFANFIGTESCIFFPVGWEINATVIALLCRRDPTKKGRVLIMSDELNHASIIVGCKMALSFDFSTNHRAKVVTFKNNSPQDLEAKLCDITRKFDPSDFQKIIIITEGIYSMEGNILNLREFVRIKQKFKAYLYVDEAHSIGAIGKTCRGICEFSGVDPHDVDVLMGTFTKSFASVGGYCSGSKSLIDFLEKQCISLVKGRPMSYGCLLQIRRILDCLSEKDFAATQAGKLLKNSRLMRTTLEKAGVICHGDPMSPVIPIIVSRLTTMSKVSRKCLENGICVVVAGFPATSYDKARVRLCMSAAHTDSQIEHACKIISSVIVGYGDFTKFDIAPINPLF